MLLILSFLLIQSTTAYLRTRCDACFYRTCYTKNKILEDFKFSGQLAIDYNTNYLYLHFKNGSDVTGIYDLDNLAFKNINLNFTFAKTVDQNARDVYMSGTFGVYKFNPITNENKIYGLADKTIRSLQYTDKLYYTVYLSNGIYSFSKKPSIIPGTEKYLVEDFIIDKLGDIYFVSGSVTYKLKKGETEAKIFKKIIFSLTTDKYGNAYFIQPVNKGLYSLNYEAGVMVEVGAFGSGMPFTTVLDNTDYFVYYDANVRKLFYLKPIYGRCTVTRRRSGHGRGKVLVIKGRRT